MSEPGGTISGFTFVHEDTTRMCLSRAEDVLDVDFITQKIDAKVSVVDETSEGAAATKAFSIPEILIMILKHAIPNPVNYEEYVSLRRQLKSRTFPPWTFLLVCKHWHEVVVSTPTLWSIITLLSYAIAPVGAYTGHEDLSSLLNVYLRRSKAHPLSLTVVLIESPVDINALWGNLLSCQQRWHIVTLDILIRDHPKDIGPTCPTKFTLRLCKMKTLEKLRLNFNSGESEAHLIVVELGPCPSLKELEVHSGVFIREGRLVEGEELFFPNLRSVTIDLEMYKEEVVNFSWRALLRHSPNLQRLKISCVAFGVGSAVVPLKLPNLQRLEIRSMNIQHLLQCFALPPTTRLKLTDVNAEFNNKAILSYSNAFQKLNVEDLTFLLPFDHKEILLFSEEVSEAFLRSTVCLRSLTFTLHRSVFHSLCLALASLFSCVSHVDSDSFQGHHRAFAHLKSLRIELFEPMTTAEINFTCLRDLLAKCRETFCDSDFRFELSLPGTAASGSEESRLSNIFRRELRDFLYSDTMHSDSISNYFVVCINGIEL